MSLSLRALGLRPGPGPLAVLLAFALTACDTAPVPDEVNATVVLGAPVLASAPQGERLFLLTEQSLRRTEKRNRPSGRLMVDGSVTFSVMRYELWALDPATLAVDWRKTVQEYRPSAEAVAPRLAGVSADAVWWQGGAAGALATRDGQTLVDAAAPAPGSEPAGAFNAQWYFHAGPASGAGGPLRLPHTQEVLRAHDPDGHYRLQVSPVHEDRAGPLRVHRMVGDGPDALWTATLPLARLHALSATDGALVFFGAADGGKVPGTDHEAQGSHVLVAVDTATGRVTALDVGQASLAPAPP